MRLLALRFWLRPRLRPRLAPIIIRYTYSYTRILTFRLSCSLCVFTLKNFLWYLYVHQTYAFTFNALATITFTLTCVCHYDLVFCPVGFHFRTRQLFATSFIIIFYFIWPSGGRRKHVHNERVRGEKNHTNLFFSLTWRSFRVSLVPRRKYIWFAMNKRWKAFSFLWEFQ